MSDQTQVTVSIPVVDEQHGDEVRAVMQRVGEICSKIVAADPKTWYGLGRALQEAEDSTPDCNYAEVEFASYLAGLAVRDR